MRPNSRPGPEGSTNIVDQYFNGVVHEKQAERTTLTTFSKGSLHYEHLANSHGNQAIDGQKTHTNTQTGYWPKRRSGPEGSTNIVDQYFHDVVH